MRITPTRMAGAVAGLALVIGTLVALRLFPGPLFAPRPAEAPAAQSVTFHLTVVDPDSSPGDTWNMKLKGTAETVRVRTTPLLDQRHIATASAGIDERQVPQLLIVFTPDGARRFAEVTGAHIGRRVGLVVDGELLWAPVIREAVSGGRVTVSGNLTVDETAAMAAAIRSAAAKAVGLASTPIADTPRPEAPRNITPQAARPAKPTAVYTNSWALVVGVNAYQKVSPRLNYAAADARAVAEALVASGFPAQNVRLLVDGDATKARIESALYQELSRVGPDDRLLVYFSGHGETVPIRGGEEGFLLPVDADPRALPLTAISMDELRRIGQRLRAKHILFVLDACFSGFALTRDITPQRTTDEYLAAALREPVIQVLAAGRKGERAIEERGHGLFTRRFLDGLRLADTEGRGFFTAAQLAVWVEPRVVNDSGGRMTPQWGRLDGEGQFVFFRP
ncbi:MAG: caspase family protein [Candidatus Rokubacteria bacterium]|nr:caspase family protein [Candidatus Rokubacteria bacterium]